MRTRIATIASATALAAMLAACGSPNPYGANNYPAGPAPVATYPAGTYPVQGNYTEFGRVSNIEVVQTAAAPRNNGTAGTLIGGVVGGLLGNTIGGGSGRAAATVLGAVGGAVVGNHIARNNDGSYNSATGNVYRVTVQTDAGQWRSYDVGATGDLHIGDRVRIENNVLYRS
ncbi:MAG: glycine zipper 2TM domain-containing protein [Ramlibacter sp.]